MGRKEQEGQKNPEETQTNDTVFIIHIKMSRGNVTSIFLFCYVTSLIDITRMKVYVKCRYEVMMLPIGPLS